MNIKYFAYIRDYTKEKELNFEHCETLRILLEKLCARYGRGFEQKIFSGHELSDEIIILINGRHIVHLKGLDTPLEAGDEISIFPVVAGG